MANSTSNIGADVFGGGSVAGLENFGLQLGGMLPQNPPNYVPVVTGYGEYLTQNFSQNIAAADQFQNKTFSDVNAFFAPLFTQQQAALSQVATLQANALQTAGVATANAAANSGGKK